MVHHIHSAIKCVLCGQEDLARRARREGYGKNYCGSQVPVGSMKELNTLLVYLYCGDTHASGSSSLDERLALRSVCGGTDQERTDRKGDLGGPATTVTVSDICHTARSGYSIGLSPPGHHRIDWPGVVQDEVPRSPKQNHIFTKVPNCDRKTYVSSTKEATAVGHKLFDAAKPTCAEKQNVLGESMRKQRPHQYNCK